MKRQKGQTAVMVILVIPAIILLLAFTLAVGKLIYTKIRLQNAADGAAYTAALWQARGLNVISDLNWAILAGGAGDIISFNPDFTISKKIMKVQDGAKASFPGVAAFAMYTNFKSNNGGGVILPVPAGLADGKMFSLRVKRHEIIQGKELDKVIPSFMVKDEAGFWLEQRRTGPLIRVGCVNYPEEAVFGGKLLNWRVPGQYAVASALPFSEGAGPDEKEYLGGLWLPHFYPKLIPFGVGLPGLAGVLP